MGSLCDLSQSPEARFGPVSLREKVRMWGLAGLAIAALAGCASQPTASPASARPATAPAAPAIEKIATAPYWYNQPGVATISSPDFDKLWSACAGAARQDGYVIDRTDYRDGVITTKPLISKQAFEFWRHDVVAVHDIVQSTLATIRRTVRFEIRRRDDDDTFQCTPKVLVERFSSGERRITSEVQYREIFSHQQGIGNRALDQGAPLPDAYWYAIGRDRTMEQHLAGQITRELKDAR